MEAKYSEHPSMFRNHPPGFVGAILLIPVVIGIVILVVWYLRCKSTLLVFDGSDLIMEQGLLSKARTEVHVASIRTVKVYQSLFNRVFSVGRIEIYTAGDQPEIQVAGIPDPYRLQELLNAHQSG